MSTIFCIIFLINLLDLGGGVCYNINMENAVKKLTPEQQELVMKNVKLVYHVYHNTYTNPLPWLLAWEEDVIEEGMVGLCRAALAFKPELGFKFATFAVPCIRNQMGMLIRKIKNDFMVDSLDEVLGSEDEEGGNTLLEMLSSDALSPEEVCELEEDKEFILNVLSGAPEKTRFIFKQLLLHHKKPGEIWIEYFADKTIKSVNRPLMLGKCKIRKLHNLLGQITFPKVEDYTSHLAFQEDMRRLWKARHPESFKRNQAYLKKSS